MPLTENEVLDLAMRAQNGDEAARNDLSVEYLSLVRGIVFKHKKKITPYITPDHAISEGYVGLLHAIRTWRPDMGTFDSWAAWKIYFAVLSEVRREAKRHSRFQTGTDDILDHSEMPDFEGALDTERLLSVLKRWDRTPQLARCSLVLKLLSGIDPRGPLDFTWIGAVIGIDDRDRVRKIANRAFRLICREFDVEYVFSCSEAFRQFADETGVIKC